MLTAKTMMVAVVAMATATAATTAAAVTISNIAQRTDIEGRLMDVHDGQITYWNGTYYWFGMGYQNCTEKTGLIPPFNCPGIYKAFGGCGFREDHAVNLYTSVDLKDWKFVANVFPPSSRPNGIYFRPKVLYNSRTDKFVLWINYLPPASSPLKAYGNATYIVATSTSPSGPYSVVRQRANVKNNGGGDFTLFRDPNSPADAYIAYDAWSNSHKVSIEQLTPDFLDSLGNQANGSTGPLSGSSNEAPIMFERLGWYFLLYGPTCCFCSAGSGSNVLTARHPMGPWKNSGIDINPKSWSFGSRVIKAQESFVIRVPSFSNDEKPDIYIYVGDRWDSAPDKLKSHDFQYWQPLSFNDTASPPTISKLSFLSNFTITTYDTV